MSPSAPPSTLVVLQGSGLPLSSLQQLLSQHGVAPDSAVITTQPGSMGSSSNSNSGGAAAAFSKALVLASSADAGATLGAVAKLLQPGGSVVVQLHGGQPTDVSSLMLLSGFTNCQSSSTGSATTVTGQLPEFAVGSKDSIKLKSKGGAAAGAAAATAKPAAWLLAGGDDLGGDEELVDDEELLTEEDRQRPAAASKQDDCEIGAGGARKACKDCTCGRADAEARGEKVELTQEMLDNPQSSCGNCSLGDAFRCAGCPYRGLPAFENGKAITLPADFLTADA